MSEVPILKETTRSTGREALRNNITAAMALAGAVRSTLGPLGQDKLLIDDEGRTMVTNDGVTVLESAKVEHPVAKMLINASTTQDRIARDGTTSAVLFSAELLQNAWELVLQGVHPSAIARGYRFAEEACRGHFSSLTLQANEAMQHQAAVTLTRRKNSRSHAVPSCRLSH
jgi:chaperonin GroEL (HSP60 family)